MKNRLLLVILLFFILFESDPRAFAEPEISIRNRDDGGYSINVSFAVAHSSTSTKTPSSTDCTARKVAVRIYADLTRYAPDVSSAALSIPNATNEPFARAGIITNVAAVENATALSLSHQFFPDAVPHSTFGTRVAATFIFPLLSPNATEEDVFTALFPPALVKNEQDNTTSIDEKKTLTLTLAGLPAAANVTAVSATYQFQQMERQQFIGGGTGRDFYRHKRICQSRNKAQSSFLMTFLKKGEDTKFITSGSGGASSLISSLNKNFFYWLGGLGFDFRSSSRQVCWVDDVLYQDQEVINGSTPVVRCAPNVTGDAAAAAAAANETLFSYASTSSTDASDPFLYCARPAALGCYNETSSPALVMPLELGPDNITVFDSEGGPRSFGLALQYNSGRSAWEIAAIAATNTSGRSVCARLSSIADVGVTSGGDTTVYAPEAVLVTAVNLIPPLRSCSFSPSRSNTTAPTLSSAQTPTTTHLATDTLSHSYTNQSESQSPQADKSASFSQSLVPTPTVTHDATPTESDSGSVTVSETRGTFSRTLTTSRSRPTPSRSQSVSEDSDSRTEPSLGHSQSPDSESLSETAPTPSRSEPSISVSLSPPPPNPTMRLENTTKASLAAASSIGGTRSKKQDILKKIFPWQVPFESVGPTFAGGRGDGGETAVVAAARPEKDRRLAWAVSFPAHLVLNVSASGGSCFLHEKLDPFFHGTSTADSSSAAAMAKLTELQKRRVSATRWLMQNARFQVINLKEVVLTLPVIPSWALARTLFGADAGMDVLALRNDYEAIVATGSMSTGCFIGAITHPTPDLRFGVLPPLMHLAPSVTMAETAITVARATSLVLAPFVFAPHAAPMMVARSGYAVYLVQCIDVPTSGPSPIEYPFRIAVGADGGDSSDSSSSSDHSSAEGSGTKNTDDTLAVYMGATLGNLLLLVIIVAVGAFAAQLNAMQAGITTKEAKARLRFPSCWVVVPVFLFTDVILRGAAFVLFSGDGAVVKGLGLVVSLGAVIALGAGYKSLMYRVLPSAKFELVFHRYAHSAASTRQLVHFAFGPFRWRNRMKTEVDELKVKSDEGEDAKEGEKEAEENLDETLERLLNDGDDETKNDDNDNKKKKKKRGGGGGENAQDEEEEEEEEEEDDDEMLSLAERQKKERLKREAYENARTPVAPGFTHRNNRFFRTYNLHNRGFIAFELAIVALCGFYSASRPSLLGCAVSTVLFCVTIAGYLAVLIWRRPWVCKLEFGSAIFFSLGQFASGVLLSYGFFVESYSSSLAAAQLAAAMEALIVLKLVLDVALRLWLWRTRKGRLEHEAFVEHEAMLKEKERAEGGSGGQTLLNIGAWYKEEEEEEGGRRGGDEGDDEEGKQEEDAADNNDEQKQKGEEDDDDGTDDRHQQQQQKKKRRKRGESYVMIPTEALAEKRDGNNDNSNNNSKSKDEEGYIEKGPTSDWQPDGDALVCNSCQLPFTITRRRSHCRALGCLLVFCSTCVPHRVSMYDPRECAIVKNQKCCDGCFQNQENRVGKGRISKEQEAADAAAARGAEVSTKATEGDAASAALGAIPGLGNADAATAMPRAISTELWDKDADWEACSRCDVEFDAMNRHHHCRRCGRIFCGDCAGAFIPMLSESGEEVLQNQRCCTRCLPKKKKPMLGRDVQPESLLMAGLFPSDESQHQQQRSSASTEVQGSTNSFSAAEGKKKSGVELALEQSIWNVAADAGDQIDVKEFFKNSNQQQSSKHHHQQQHQNQGSKKKQAVAAAATKKADAVTDRIMGSGAGWLSSVRMNLGRSFDRDEAILREELQRDSGAGKGPLLSHLKMSPAARKKFDVPFDDDDDDDDDGDNAGDDEAETGTEMLESNLDKDHGQKKKQQDEEDEWAFLMQPTAAMTANKKKVTNETPDDFLPPITDDKKKNQQQQQQQQQPKIDPQTVHLYPTKQDLTTKKNGNNTNPQQQQKRESSSVSSTIPAAAAQQPSGYDALLDSSSDEDVSPNNADAAAAAATYRAFSGPRVKPRGASAAASLEPPSRARSPPSAVVGGGIASHQSFALDGGQLEDLDL